MHHVMLSQTQSCHRNFKADIRLTVQPLHYFAKHTRMQHMQYTVLLNWHLKMVSVNTITHKYAVFGADPSSACAARNKSMPRQQHLIDAQQYDSMF